MWFGWSKHVDTRDSLVFQRIQQFYSIFIGLAALVSGLAIGALKSPKLDQSATSLTQISDAFFCSSALTAIVSTVVGTMLLFYFEGQQGTTGMDLIVAWTPLVLLDVSIIELLIGIACWYSGHNVYWRGVLMASQLAGLLGFCIALSIWMWFRMSQQGEEKEGNTTTIQKHVADD